SFLRSLYYEADDGHSSDKWEVDWADAPLTYKLYRGRPYVRLSPEIPLSLPLKTISQIRDPNMTELGHFLWYTFGLTQISYAAPLSAEQQSVYLLYRRRFALSGGAMYPHELYIYLQLEALPWGINHNDNEQHRLVFL